MANYQIDDEYYDSQSLAGARILFVSLILGAMGLAFAFALAYS